MSTRTGSEKPEGEKSKKSKEFKKRVARACDNCRIRKSRCDGLSPCSLCSLHGVDCSYDALRKSKRRDLNYILELEKAVRRLTAHLEEQQLKALPSLAPPLSGPSSGLRLGQTESASDDTALETMIRSAGQLSIDDFGNYEYHGNSSGLTVLQRIRELCNALLMDGQDSSPQNASPAWACAIHPFGTSSPLPPASSIGAPQNILPDKDTASRLVSIAFDQAFPLLHVIDQAEFSDKLDKAYSTLNGVNEALDRRFVALLYELLAIGQLYSSPLARPADATVGGKTDQQRAEEYFLAGKEMLDFIDCRDLTSVQAIICIIIYLQSSAVISTCYSYISLALTACTRMGLHRSVALKAFNMDEQEKRKRVFWVLRTMDSYITTTLGLPRTICDKDIDQDIPADVETLQTPPTFGNPSPLNAVNDHIRLMLILDKVREYVHGGSKSETTPGGSYCVPRARIVEVEQELEEWFRRLPDPAGTTAVSKEFEKEQLLLRLFHAHVQMVLYRPFLHHITKNKQDPDFDFHAYACASACIRASMQVIWLDRALKERGYLNGSYWFTVYINFFAIVCLTMFNLSNRNDPTAQDALSTAVEGYQILKEMASYNFVADRCIKCLTPMFETLCEERGLSSPDKADFPNLAPQDHQITPAVQLDVNVDDSVFDPLDFQLSAGMLPAAKLPLGANTDLQAASCTPAHPYLNHDLPL